MFIVGLIPALAYYITYYYIGITSASLSELSSYFKFSLWELCGPMSLVTLENSNLFIRRVLLEGEI